MNILELRQKRTELWEQTKNFLEGHRDENGFVQASALEQYNKIEADVVALGKQIEILENQAAIENELKKSTGSPVLMPVGAPVQAPKANVAPTATDEYRTAFFDMLRGHGYMPNVMNALTVGTNADGGYTVPNEFEKQLIQKLTENNVFRQMAHTIRTNSGNHVIPVANGGITAGWLDEGDSITEVSATFSQVLLNAYKLGSLIKISNELLNDSAFDLASYVAEEFGKAMGQTEESAFINGDGDKKPTGILNSTGGAQLGATAASETAITFDEIMELYYSLKAPYRKNAKFLTNEGTVHYLRTIKDTTGRYIWNVSVKEGEPDTLLGHPVVTSAQYPTKAAGIKAICFGDFSNYWIADRTSRSFRRLNELFAQNDLVGFMATQRVDGKLILPESVKYLVMAGTVAAQG